MDHSMVERKVVQLVALKAGQKAVQMVVMMG